MPNKLWDSSLALAVGKKYVQIDHIAESSSRGR